MPLWPLDEALLATMRMPWHKRLACMPRASRKQWEKFHLCFLIIAPFCSCLSQYLGIMRASLRYGVLITIMLLLCWRWWCLADLFICHSWELPR